MLINTNHSIDKIKDRKQFIQMCIKRVASLLHHTPSNSKKSYIYPYITELYMNKPEKLTEIYVGTKYSIEKTFKKILQMTPKKLSD